MEVPLEISVALKMFVEMENTLERLVLGAGPH